MNIHKFSRYGLLALTLATSAIATPNFAHAQDKMSDSKMSGDKMHDNKMSGDKMLGDKMHDNKMGAAMTSAHLSGGFKQVTHATSGTATLVGDKLTLTNFKTGAGPKLHVYLVQGDVSSNAAIKKAVAAKKFTDLGLLKSTSGNQNYALPKGAHAQGASVVVWCAKFNVAFGSAKLG